MNNFEIDLAAIQKRSREKIADGPITDAYAGDREKVVAVLNDALATEIVCVLRYRSHYFQATGLAAKSIAAEFLEHANEEQDHADRIAERIVQLQGVPNFSPSGLAERAHSQFTGGDTLTDLLTEDLVAERIAIEIYTEVVRWLGDADPTTRVLIEGVLAMEEEHADDLASLLNAHDQTADSLRSVPTTSK